MDSKPSWVKRAKKRLKYHVKTRSITRQRYTYQPLPLASDIRVLRLDAGQFGDILHGTLLITTPNGDIKYDALSYTWGDATSAQEVLNMDGTSHLMITSNLETALQHLRSSSEPRYLWVDAVCINQGDLSERSSQVSFMYNIYNSARQVVVWLGTSDESSDLAFDIAERLPDEEVEQAPSELLRLHNSLKNWDQRKSTWFDIRSLIEEGSAEHFNLLRFFQRPWFFRVWVQQEIAACKHKPYVQCSFRIVQWERIFALLWVIERSTKSGMTQLGTILTSEDEDDEELDMNKAAQMIQNMELLRRDCFTNGDAQGEENLLYNLESTRHALASDDRDRIYALQTVGRGNPHDACPWIPSPDYFSTTSQTYTRFATAYLERCFTLILIHAGSGFCEIDGLSSWAPDWSFPYNPRQITTSGWSCCGSTLGNSRVSSNNGKLVLITEGVIFDTVSELSGCLYEDDMGDHPLDDQLDAMSKLEESMMHKLSLRQSYPTGETPAKAYWRTLIGSSDYEDASESLDNMEDMIKWQRQRLVFNRADRNAATVTDSAFQYYAHEMEVTSAFALNKVCFTSKGYFGVVPQTARQGDYVALIPGCPQPLVLHNLRNGQYENCGSCFVHGIMRIEASYASKQRDLLSNSRLLAQNRPENGPLPAGWREVYPKESLRGFNFDKDEDWAFNLRDPRYELHEMDCPACPPGWQDVTCRGDKFFRRQGFLNSRISQRLPETWTQLHSDYGPFFVNRKEGYCTFDDPRYLEELQSIPFPDGCHSVEVLTPIHYFLNVADGTVSWRDPRHLRAAETISEDWTVSYNFNLQYTYFKSRKDDTIASLDDPRFPNPMTGPVPAGWTAVRQNNGGSEDTIVFTETSTGRTTTEDPCLLPGAVFPGFVIV